MREIKTDTPKHMFKKFNNSVMWLSDASLCPLPKPFARPWRAQSPGRPSWRNSWQPWKLTWRKSPRKKERNPQHGHGLRLRLGKWGDPATPWWCRKRMRRLDLRFDGVVTHSLQTSFFFSTGGLFAWEDMAIWKPTLELEPIVLKTDGGFSTWIW